MRYFSGSWASTSAAYSIMCAGTRLPSSKRPSRTAWKPPTHPLMYGGRSVHMQTDRPISFDSYNGHYDEAVNDAVAFSKLKVDFFVRVKATCMHDILAAHFGDPSRVNLLDVGCGIGNYHPYWIDQVGLLRGVDISAKCIGRAAESNPRVA